MGRIKCKRCHGDEANLTLKHDPDRTPYIYCSRCGNRVYKDTPDAVVKPKPESTVPESLTMCTGCEKNPINAKTSRTGLCKNCGNKLRSWQQGAGNAPPPFVKVLGVYVENTSNDLIPRRGRPKTPTPVVQLSKDGEYIETFPSLSAAKTALSIAPGSISTCIAGRGKTAGGFKWMKEEDYKVEAEA